MEWDLTKIRSKIKNLTGRPNLADSEIDDYVNNFYQYILPQEVSALELKTWFEASTSNGTGEYLLDSDMIAVRNPVTIDGTRINLYGPSSTDTFFIKYPRDNEAASEYTKPTDALQDDRTLFLRPIPDDTYTVKAAVYKRPTALSTGSDRPLDDSWGPLISYFAAIEIYIDKGEADEAANLTQIYNGYRSSINIKKLLQLTEQQAIPRF